MCDALVSGARALCARSTYDDVDIWSAPDASPQARLDDDDDDDEEGWLTHHRRNITRIRYVCTSKYVIDAV